MLCAGQAAHVQSFHETRWEVIRPPRETSENNMEQVPSMVCCLFVAIILFPTKIPSLRSANNTIHIDDLSRNFALNYSCGLKISAFKDAHTLHGVADRELFKLSQYLVHIASFFPDFNGIDHKVQQRFLLPSLAEFRTNNAGLIHTNVELEICCTQPQTIFGLNPTP
jgi:NLI interacting factor-like phosphatase